MHNPIHVIGVHHSVKHPGFVDVKSFIDQCVSAGERIAMESPWDARQIERDGATHRDPNYQFLYDITMHLRRKQAHVFPVEDMELYQHSANLKHWYMFEGRDVLEADERWHELSIKRGIRHLQLAHERECTKLLTGIAHACELSMMGYRPVTYIPANDPGLHLYQKDMQPHIEKFGVDLGTGEWKNKVYTLLSDMTLVPGNE